MTISPDIDEIEELLTIADEWLIPDLKDKCAERLIDSIKGMLVFRFHVVTFIS